ncbi:heme exporter protein CcmD [Cognatishimia activa]|uniref:Heme exporter protein D n=1 Tax=Cognatishimia activa TaxID=1715691 RepID=A0A0P1JBF5_9RHOB|nr:heme exporter protein CcmD [Cognatishimia activa]CUI80273.1 heme exporter protein CcmD [Cognatishimia activa]CUK26870.1 heme exporter protein CcmD [Cognatishimia activa]
MMPDLGKYAGTVLSAYGASIILIVGLVWLSVRAAKKSKKALDKLEQNDG